MSEIVFLTSSESYRGAEEAGITLRVIDDPESCEQEILNLAERGFSMIVLTEELAAGRSGRIIESLGGAAAKTTLLVVPAPDGTGAEHLQYLRDRFSVALGIDIWSVTAKRAGVHI
jgi:vacuolar-type H+-ATPase subunit F/Vma7